jgi:hypothetical protein
MPYLYMATELYCGSTHARDEADMFRDLSATGDHAWYFITDMGHLA